MKNFKTSEVEKIKYLSVIIIITSYLYTKFYKIIQKQY